MAATETFPSIEASFGTSKDRSYRVRRSDFGEGYSQRVQDGPNAQTEKIPILFENLSTADANTIETFLDARGGHEAFLFTMPGEATERQWTCAGFKRTPVASGMATIRATFVQEFDL